MKTFTFIDLFAGIGGLRIPFDELGGKCVYSSEWDKYAQITYSINFGDKPHGDITKVKASDIPSHDLILAGFPCQPFSHAGLRKGFSDIRGTLFFDIARIARYHKPKVMLLENVKGFKGHDRGRTFETVRRVIETELGYMLSYKVFNAKDFGLPQNRERIFMVAIKDGEHFESFEFPNAAKVSTQVGNILQTKVDPKYTISDKIWASHQRRKRDHIAKGNGFGYSLFDNLSEYTSTISARYYKDGAEILINQDGNNPRKLTPREAARLQGFPETFQICVSDTQAYKQLGNSVPVNVVRAIAKQIVKTSFA